MAKKQIGAALAAARREAGLSMREACRKAKISHSILWKAEHGIAIRYASLLKILSALGIRGEKLREFQRLYSIDTFGVGEGVLEGRRELSRKWQDYLLGLSPTLQGLPDGLRKDMPAILADDRMVRLIAQAWALRGEPQPTRTRRT